MQTTSSPAIARFFSFLPYINPEASFQSQRASHLYKEDARSNEKGDAEKEHRATSSFGDRCAITSQLSTIFSA